MPRALLTLRALRREELAHGVHGHSWWDPGGARLFGLCCRVRSLCGGDESVRARGPAAAPRVDVCRVVRHSCHVTNDNESLRVVDRTHTTCTCELSIHEKSVSHGPRRGTKMQEARFSFAGSALYSPSSNSCHMPESLGVSNFGDSERLRGQRQSESRLSADRTVRNTDPIQTPECSESSRMKVWKGPAAPRPARMRTWPGRAAARRDARARGGGCGRGGPRHAPPAKSPNHARDKSNSKTRPTTAKAQDARPARDRDLRGLSADCAARTDLGARTRLVTPVVSTAHTHAITYVRCANAARAPRERHAQSSRTESAATLQPLYMYDHRLARLLL